MTRFRDDKGVKEATDLERLKVLFKLSKEEQNIVVPTTIHNSLKRSHSETESETETESEEKDEEPKRKILKKVDSSELPTIFENRKFYLSDKVFKKDQLKRYIIA